MVVALFAALIAPWFINWDDYKTNFEAEAARILGQPVRVNGTADASILPSPSLTFTDVEVGETEGQPMMSVKRFSVTIELMPLIQGEIRVISMKLEEPVVRVAVDDEGRVDWTIRGEASRDLDPDNVALSGVEITNGKLIYDDARSGSSVTISDIAATVEARSLAGPWRVEGSYITDGAPAQFQISTGRRLEDGSLRVKADVTPGQWPIAIGADGVVTQGDGGPSYAGTYNLTQVLPAATENEEARGDITGWRSEGSFKLTRDQLVVDKAVLSEGPPDRPSSLAGSMTLTLGPASRFFATVQARQLDLDRSLGAGPKKPIEMATAADEFVKWLRGIPVPGIAGTVRFNVPAIVVGGAVIQDVSFAASPADNGWYIEGLRARLPGSATFAADGNLMTGEHVSFGGDVRLAVNQPATFAAWWRGKSEAGTGRLLAPFELSSEKATVTLDGLRVEQMTTRIGDATITGGFSWTDAADGARTLGADVEADRLDFVQVRALAELLGGRELSEAGSLAHSYEVRLKANELLIDSFTMKGVSVDASFKQGELNVTELTIEDVGGARLGVKSGKIANVMTEPVGQLQLQLNTSDVPGLVPVVDKLAPDSRFAHWLRASAPYLSPLNASIGIQSRIVDGRAVTEVKLDGKANATTPEAKIVLTGAPLAWRDADIEVDASVTSYNAVELARQIGIVRADAVIEGWAELKLSGKGVPAEGLAMDVKGTFGGLGFESRGTLAMPPAAMPAFSGEASLGTDDLLPVLGMVGLSIPGVADTLPVSVSARVATSEGGVDIEWSNGKFADRTVSGRMRLAAAPDGGLRLDTGSLDIDQVDLGWIASLGLGFAPLPTGVPEAPWPTEPFGEVALKGLAADIDIATERLVVGDTLQVRNGKLRLRLARDKVDFDVKSGDVLGGTVVGGFSVRNVGGNASLTGNLSLVNGALDQVAWQRAGRPVANGTLDLSANFEATGRSPAGMIASLTGGGTLAIHDGEARYLNPRAGVLVIRDSDLGQEFTEDVLRDLFGSYIDNGNLTFPEVEAPFAIAAGTVRFQNIMVDAAETRASGSAAIDLNTMTVDSDWTLTLDSGDDKFGGEIPPQVGIVFRGPLGAPERIVDVLQFNSYLNIRKEARLQEILALEEQARLENAFFNRVKRKLREDEERAARLAEEARQARVASATNLETLHAMREVAAERRAEDELIAWWAVAGKAAADKDAAEAAAAEASAAALSARTASDAAAARVADLAAVASKAGDDVGAASAAADAADGGRSTAEANAAAAVAAHDQAVADAAAKAAAVEAANNALAAARAAGSVAATEAAAASAQSEAADRQAEATAAIAEDTRTAANAAATEAADLANALAQLEAQLATANAALDAATAEATATTQLADVLQRKADEAAAKTKTTGPTAKAAETAAGDADAMRIIAEGSLAQADTMMAAAKAAHANAMATVEAAQAAFDAAAIAATEAQQAAEAARSDAAAAAPESAITLDGGTIAVAPPATTPDAGALTTAAEEAERDAAAKADALDSARATLEAAKADRADKAAALTAAEDSLTDARAALADATRAASTARATADQAAQALRTAEMEASAATDAVAAAAEAAKSAAAIVAEGTATRDELAARVATARTAAEEAAADAGTAENDANTAASDAVAARSAAEQAAAAMNAATAALSEATEVVEAATKALAAATTAEAAAVTAVADAEAKVGETEAALAEATAASDAAKATLDNALKAASQVLEDLKAAQSVAAAALETALAAEAAAKDSAARAAAMPAGWRPGDRSGSRADAGSAPADVAVVEADALSVLDEPLPAINLIPVTPRLRPSRTAGANTAPGPDLLLPTDDRPLPIVQP